MPRIDHASSIFWASSPAWEGIDSAELCTGNHVLLAPSSSVTGAAGRAR